MVLIRRDVMKNTKMNKLLASDHVSDYSYRAYNTGDIMISAIQSHDLFRRESILMISKVPRLS